MMCLVSLSARGEIEAQNSCLSLTCLSFPSNDVEQLFSSLIELPSKGIAAPKLISPPTHFLSNPPQQWK